MKNRLFCFMSISLLGAIGSQWAIAESQAAPAHHSEHAQHGQMMQTERENPFEAVSAQMMQDMHALTATGDVNYDFMRGMIPHHQGAIGMAKVMLEQGGDEPMLTLAREIVAAQETEISQMQAWLQEYGQPQPGDQAQDIIAALQRIDQRMMADMQLPSSGDVTKDFVLGMIPHHIAAVDMAYVLLAHSTHADLRDMAHAVIREQEREIRQLNAWLQNADAPVDAHPHH